MKNILFKILLMTSLCILNFGCKKNESNPVQPPPTVEPNKAVYFVSPKAGDTLYNGMMTRIQWKIHKDSIVKRVVIEVKMVGTSDNQNFEPFIEAQADSLSTEYKIQLQKRSYYMFRIRDIERSEWDSSGVFRVDDLYFAIFYPNKGDLVNYCSTISIDFKNYSNKTVWFGFSTDDGNSWKFIKDPKNWFVDVNPGNQCRLLMQTDDASMSYTTKNFLIVSKLDEFFPLRVGMIMRYEYYHGSLARPWDSSRYRYTIEINSSITIKDTTVYTCRVSYQNFYPNQDSSTVYSTFTEYNFGLHPIFSRIAPFDRVPVYRYSPTPVLQKSDSYTNENHDAGWSWTQKKGLGITSYGTWSGRQLNSSGEDYTLL